MIQLRKSTNMEARIEIIPAGVNFEPLFKTDEEYQRFCEDFTEKVTPEIEKWNRASALSWLDAQFRIVD